MEKGTGDSAAAEQPDVSPAIELRGRVQRLRRLMDLIEERSPETVALTGVRYRNPKTRGQYLHR
jgi:hypothetical protein